MTPEEFVKGFYLEHKSLVDLYLKPSDPTHVSILIQSLDLDNEKTKVVHEIIKSVLQDAFYTILLGLDGEAQIGGRQERYSIKDENGIELTGGEIEALAWEYFHNNKLETDENKAGKQ